MNIFLTCNVKSFNKIKPKYNLMWVCFGSDLLEPIITFSVNLTLASSLNVDFDTGYSKCQPYVYFCLCRSNVTIMLDYLEQ